MRRLSRMADALEALVEWLGRLSAVALLVLVLVMAGNVLLRYGFAAGSVWAQELEWHLMSPIALLGAAWALKHGEHVRVDVLYARLGRAWQNRIEWLSGLAGLLVSLAVIWLSWRYVMQSWNQGEGSPNPGGIPARYLLKAFIPLGFSLLALQFAATLLRLTPRLR
ncbi:MAG: TRAP transporter small permease subunit [Rhodovarius sp.]|nr:TRAP transporter small permease subunit [Rhodovarius sp.]MCX7933143.1 TRAP transporter small permease subunit [Rhodovarius sp.]